MLSIRTLLHGIGAWSLGLVSVRHPSRIDMHAKNADPFATFTEWASEADEQAYKNL
jgi:hypothetical protein